MRIVQVKKVEDCFDGSSVYRYWFDTPWTRDAIMGLKALGDLEYFADFPRPFFRVCGHRGLHVKGVEGEDNCQAIFPKQGKEEIQNEFGDLIRTINETGTAI